MTEFSEFRSGIGEFLDKAGPDAGLLAVCVAMPKNGTPVAWTGSGKLASQEQTFIALSLAMKSLAAPFVRSEEEALKLLEGCLEWCRRTRSGSGEWLQQAGSWEDSQMPDPGSGVPVQ